MSSMVSQNARAFLGTTSFVKHSFAFLVIISFTRNCLSWTISSAVF